MNLHRAIPGPRQPQSSPLKISVILGLIGFLATACGGVQKEHQGAPHKLSGAPAVEATTTPTTNPEVAGQEKSPAPGFITRRDLDTVLAAGPGAILAAVITEPVLKNGRFIGFKIARFSGDAPRAIDLRAGDVILKANGRKIERPENYFAVLEDLRIASELRFDVLRNGEPTTLIYPILDTSSGDIPETTTAD